MSERREHGDDLPTVAAIAALAFIAACVAHEAIGHGGACALAGGRIELLTSVYFSCAPGSAWSDAAGPLMNLVAGLAFWIALRLIRPTSEPARLLLVLAAAFNLFWGSGYFIYSAISGMGDWAFLLRDPATRTLRITLLGGLGVVLYMGSMRLIASAAQPPARLIAAYVAGGATACASTLFFVHAVAPALREAALESFGAAIGLVLLTRRRAAVTASPLAPALARSHRWLAAAAIVVAVFFATLGRGIA